MNKLKAYLTLIRYPLFAIPLVATLPGVILANEQLTWRAGVTLFVALLGYWAGMIKNDYFHRAHDAIANPHRPLPSRKLNPRDAFMVASTLYVICLILGFLVLNYKAGLMVIVLIMISHVYNALLKERGIWGSISLPMGIGLLSVFGALAVSGSVPTLVWYVFAATTLFDFGTHITTTFKDIERDKSIGIATTPLQIGIKPALTVSWIVTIAACVIALLPSFLGNVSPRYVLWIILALGATCVTRIPLIFHQTEKNGYLALKGSMIASITFFPSLMGIAMPLWQSAAIILPLLGVTIALLEMVKPEV
ncbi:hypothetical protein FJZ31_05670 [Candidatus Poribacteria bacterium]|nr:hypothetical protein [Candidatus Poribacteria bacterium]